MIRLKQLLIEYREKSHSWLSPSGRIIPIKNTHDFDARRIIPSQPHEDVIMKFWKLGYQRVTYMYDGSLIVNNEIMPPNDKQLNVLKNIAIEGDHEKIEYDGGEKSYILWSNSDVLEKKI